MPVSVYFKKYDTDKGSVIAVCDSDLIGKVYRESSTVIDLDKYSGFYKGELIGSKEAEEMFADADIYTANVVGKESVGLFVKNGIVSEESIRTVQGIPFVHVYKLV